MEFQINKAISILSRTPEILSVYLQDLSPEWTKENEGENTWSPYDIVGHLIHGEQTDWVVRADIILSDAIDKTFEPFDRFAQERISAGKSLADLLNEFAVLRKKNLHKIKSLNLSIDDLDLMGNHPELGPVSLRNLLSSWVVHDLGHIAQISRVMAKQYMDEVGPWTQYMSILRK